VRALGSSVLQPSWGSAGDVESKEEEVLVASDDEGARHGEVALAHEDGAYRNSGEGEAEAATPTAASQHRQNQRQEAVHSPNPPASEFPLSARGVSESSIGKAAPPLSGGSAVSATRRSVVAFAETFDDRLNDALADLENYGVTTGDILLHQQQHHMEGLLGSLAEDSEERDPFLLQRRGSTSSSMVSNSQAEPVGGKRARRRSHGEGGPARRRASTSRRLGGANHTHTASHGVAPLACVISAHQSACRPSDAPVQLSRSDICRVRPDPHSLEDSQIVFFNH